MRFAKANGACGIFSRGLIDDKRLSHPFFFPLYEAAEIADLPVCVHASTGNFDWVKLFEGENGFARFKVPVLSAFHSIVHDGIPQKFPKLRCRVHRSSRPVDSLYVCGACPAVRAR